MACRKAAYRAMTELSEWMEAQQAEAEASKAATEQELRQQWTPTSVFEQCSSVGRTSASQTRGCSGGCGKAHPRITLDYTGSKQAVATLSHELDPFVHYFEGLCQEGLATKVTTDNIGGCRYQLRGFLQSHVEKLKLHPPFGSHLIKVSAYALATSQRAQQWQADELEVKQAAKKRRTQGPADATKNLLEQVLTVCQDSHQLADHLDLADLHWMLQTNKLMASFATKLLEERQRDFEFYYEVYCRLFGAANDTRLCVTKETRWGLQSVYYKKLTSSSSSSTTGSREEPSRLVYPADAAAATTTTKETKKQVLVPQQPQEEFQLSPFCRTVAHVQHQEGNNNDSNPALFLVCVFLKAPTAKNIPEAGCFPPQQPVEVARYSVLGVPPSCEDGVFTSSFLHNQLTYKITTTMTTTIPEASSENGSSDATPIAAAAASNNAVWTSSTTAQTNTFVSIQSIAFEMKDLLGVYVRKKLPLAKAHLDVIKRKRPVTLRDKNYVKNLAKAAREAPGSKQDFEGLRGW